MSDPTTLILQVTISSPDAPKGREVMQLDVDSSAVTWPQIPHPTSPTSTGDAARRVRLLWRARPPQRRGARGDGDVDHQDEAAVHLEDVVRGGARLARGDHRPAPPPARGAGEARVRPAPSRGPPRGDGGRVQARGEGGHLGVRRLLPRVEASRRLSRGPARLSVGGVGGVGRERVGAALHHPRGLEEEDGATPGRVSDTGRFTRAAPHMSHTAPPSRYRSTPRCRRQ